MAFVIIEISNRSASELSGWDWAGLIDEPYDCVSADAFETAEELEATVASTAASRES